MTLEAERAETRCCRVGLGQTEGGCTEDPLHSGTLLAEMGTRARRLGTGRALRVLTEPAAATGVRAGRMFPHGTKQCSTIKECSNRPRLMLATKSTQEAETF